jgi:hypothetical protein
MTKWNTVANITLVRHGSEVVNIHLYSWCVAVCRYKWIIKKYSRLLECRSPINVHANNLCFQGSQISWHSAHEGGEVSLRHRPPLPPGNVPGTHFHWKLSRPPGHGTVGRNMWVKNPVTPPGIDPGTARLVAQRLNHYATPGPNKTYTCYLLVTNDNAMSVITKRGGTTIWGPHTL